MQDKPPLTASLRALLEEATSHAVCTVAAPLDEPLGLPEITLHCADGHCGGPRVYRPDVPTIVLASPHCHLFVHFTCSACVRNTKVYALRLVRHRDGEVEVTKFGEYPSPWSEAPPKGRLAALSTRLGDSLRRAREGYHPRTSGIGLGDVARLMLDELVEQRPGPRKGMSTDGDDEA